MFHECNVTEKDGKIVPDANFVKEGVCQHCGAPIYVEENQAKLVVRPMLHYTCSDRNCPGRMQEPYWAPRSFQAALSLGKRSGKKPRPKPKPRPESKSPIIIVKTTRDYVEEWME